MQDKLKAFFEKENIEFFRSFATDSTMELKYARKMPEWAKSGVAFLIPYRTASAGRNVSEYAVPRDYHLYIKELSERLEGDFGDINVRMQLFADNSPFFERDIAQRTGLGFFGKNHMFINEKYGSFVFIGELLLDFEVNISSGASSERNTCFDCGACIRACPGRCLSGNDFSGCLSALTQQKKLSDCEKDAVAGHTLVWGCDICQDVCPHNRNIPDTPIDFFRKERLPVVDTKLIADMTEDEFCKRAFSWRGREVILRNLSLHDIF